jgi:tetratricopeptide (TPR) repeat protein
MERLSVFKYLDLPPAFGVVLLTVALALLLAPYLQGADFGSIKIPIFDIKVRNVLKVLGPVALVGCVALFLPVLPHSPPNPNFSETLTALESRKKALDQEIERQPAGKQKMELQQQRDEVASVLDVTRKQIRAVQLLDLGRTDEAVAALDDADKKLDVIPNISNQIRNQRGYNYKTLAQVFLSRGDRTQANRYLDKASNVFEVVWSDANGSTQDRARAIHGIGNVKSLRGDTRGAIADFERAIALDARTPYAWYDRFLAYADLAEKGTVDLAAMRESLNRTKDIDALTPLEIDSLEAILRRYKS